MDDHVPGDPDELVARCSNRRLSPVTVLLDPYDDAAVTAALLAAHDPRQGRVVVHPTPAVSNRKGLGHDLLLALGRPIRRLSGEQVSGATPAWQAAIAWIAAGDIDLLIVLRAHRLRPGNWEQLLELWRCTGVRLVLVCHDPKIPRDAARLLESVDHFVTKDLDEVVPARGPLPVRSAPDPPVRELPQLPDADVVRFRADAYRWLDPAEFARVDAVYGQGLAAACRWLPRHPDTQVAKRVEVGHYLRGVFPDYMRPDEIAIGTSMLAFLGFRGFDG